MKYALSSQEFDYNATQFLASEWLTLRDPHLEYETITNFEGHPVIVHKSHHMEISRLE